MLIRALAPRQPRSPLSALHLAAPLPLCEIHMRQMGGAVPASRRPARRRARARRLPGDPDAARTSYGETAYARLVALTDEWDPANVLRLNQTIEPSAG